MRTWLAMSIVLVASPVLADPDPDPDVVASARIGVAHYLLNNPLADDSQIEGTGPTLTAEIGLRFAGSGLEAALAVEIGQFTSADYEGFQPVRDIRERMVSVTPRLRYWFTEFFDLSAGLGGAITFEHELASNHWFGYRYELAAGLRLWHRGRESVRLEGCLAITDYNVPGPNGVDFSIWQAGASLGYTARF